jgi:hypothetical protein
MRRSEFLTMVVCGIPVLGMFSHLPIRVSQPVEQSGVCFGSPETDLLIKPSDLTELRRQLQTGHVHHWRFEFREEENLSYVRPLTEMERR